MQYRTADEEAQFGRLRADYDAAFRRWTEQVRHWQWLASHSTPDSLAIKEARDRAEEAQNTYREKRNLLTDYMLASSPQSGAGQSLSTSMAGKVDDREGRGDDEALTDRRLQIEQLAHALWESAGRPIGRADEDWLRAEQLIFSKG